MSDNSLSKELIQKVNLINRLVSISLASSKIKKITVEQGGGSMLDIYPPISLYFFAKHGSLKSTMLKEVSKITKQSVLKSVTEAGLVGSISENGQGLVSPVWSHRNNIMAIDEFNSEGMKGRGAKQVILDIIEGGEYTKAIGRPIKKPTEIKEEDLFYKIEEGTISFKTRCGAIICTMVRHHADVFHFALLSRCIPIAYAITDYMAVARGLIKFSFKKIKVEEHVIIKNKDWETILTATTKYTTTDHLRMASMLARVFAVLGKHDNALYQVICGLRNDVDATSQIC